MNTLTVTTNSADETIATGRRIGNLLRGGEIIELISDLGGGKTTFVRGIAQGIASDDKVMSPTFTISRIYQAQKLAVHHFDFYRLSEPGVMLLELQESLENPAVAVVIEWSQIVEQVLPADRLQINFIVKAETVREIVLEATGKIHGQILDKMR